jgi:hypothetical protein
MTQTASYTDDTKIGVWEYTFRESSTPEGVWIRRDSAEKG